jgi:hypothetical protein
MTIDFLKEENERLHRIETRNRVLERDAAQISKALERKKKEGFPSEKR